MQLQYNKVTVRAPPQTGVWLCTAGGIQSSPVPVLRACFPPSHKSGISVHPAREKQSSLKKQKQKKNILTYSKLLHIKSVMISK